MPSGAWSSPERPDAGAGRPRDRGGEGSRLRRWSRGRLPFANGRVPVPRAPSDDSNARNPPFGHTRARAKHRIRGRLFVRAGVPFAIKSDGMARSVPIPDTLAVASRAVPNIIVRIDAAGQVSADDRP